MDHLLSKEEVRICVLTVTLLRECDGRKVCPVTMRKGETPVPIPNTTVKTLPADDTWATGHGKIGGCRAFFFLYDHESSGATPEDHLKDLILLMHLEN